MPLKRTYLSEYEEASGLQRGQLLECLTPGERQRLHSLGYRPKRLLPNGALTYLMEIFPLPDHLTELVSMSVYEKKCGFSTGELFRVLSEEQREHLHDLGYRKFCVLPFRVVVYLKSLGFY